MTKKGSRRLIASLVAGLCVLFLLILASGLLVIIPQNKIDNSTKNVQSEPTQDLATLENNDAGYTIKYPTSFEALYTQDGVEFTPYKGQGKVILQVTDGIVKVNIKPDQASQLELSILNNAAQTITNTFQFTKQTPVDKTNTDKRFENINFDPKKY